MELSFISMLEVTENSQGSYVKFRQAANVKEITPLYFKWMKYSSNPLNFLLYNTKICNNILIQKSQQDAHVTEFILSDDCSTCFGRHYHPSSGAQNNCNYSIMCFKSVYISSPVGCDVLKLDKWLMTFCGITVSSSSGSGSSKKGTV